MQNFLDLKIFYAKLDEFYKVIYFISVVLHKRFSSLKSFATQKILKIKTYFSIDNELKVETPCR